MSQLLSDHDHRHAFSDTPVGPQQTARDVLIGRQDEILRDIALPGVAAAIWERKPDVSFQAWIDNLTADQLPALRIVVPVDQAEEAVRVACDSAKTPPGAERDWFIHDVAGLAGFFGDILKVDHIQIRLDIAAGKMCPSFHRDNVPARLLCTYRGQGTEYVPEQFRNNPDRVRMMKTGAVGLFRGSQWTSGEPCGLLHRSPPVQAESGPRLLLVVDRVPPA